MAENRSYFKQHLAGLFEKIENGKPLHFKRLLLGLAECGVAPTEAESIFNKKSIGKKRYRVSIKPDAFLNYQRLKEKSLPPRTNVSARAIAAAEGRSHSKSSSGAFCLFHSEHHKNNPFTIMIDNGVPREVPILKQRLLLIENFELFLQYNSALSFLEKHCAESVSLSEWDIIYSQGSGILNKQFLPILMNYTSVYCLFDLDFGGLITFNTLRERLHAKVKFCYPTDIDYWIDKYGFDMPQPELSHLKGLLSKHKHQKNTKIIMEKLIKANKKIEQEVYLI